MNKPLLKLITVLFLGAFTHNLYSQERTSINLKQGWEFRHADEKLAYQIDFDDSKWESVTIPHDWAIYGPFDQEIDKQIVQIKQNNEKVATEKTGRTGALPFTGVGWYRNTFTLPKHTPNKQVLLTFDGAMSNAKVYINGQLVGTRNYGYSYFYFDISSFINHEKENVLAVRLENKPFSSRWYPGAGLYRKVQLIIKEKISFQHWGHYVTTPFITDSLTRVNIKSKVKGKNLRIETQIMDAEDQLVGSNTETTLYGDAFIQNIAVQNPNLWSPETPYLYTAKLKLYEGDTLKDVETIRFGIRNIEYSREKGFVINGNTTKFKGVCLHHDLGPLGTAVNKSALKRQLTILKDMGCNAIRSAHNMPSLEQLELCDEMGFFFVAESFDEWKKPKVKNGYNLLFDEWAEKDVVNLVQATQNHPCIVMWSAGNEVPDQWGTAGVKRAKWLQDIFHREDPTRPVTVGMNQVKAVMKSGFGAVLDIPGLNYKVHLYEEAYEKFPQGLILGSETASTVSSRGVYKFPVKPATMKHYDDLQSSSYDLEYCSWSNLPEDDFVLQDDKPWVIGEFVWTGFDYLGEPTPYDTFWPSRSSYFGISDLAGLPKDRYYLYRSKWNKKDETLHILPHWNWEGREGETTPVFVYTNYNSAELFINGKSQGVRTKNTTTKQDRYRLRWMDVKYEPGKVKVIAFDDNGKSVAEKVLFTAGKPHHIELKADRTVLKANGEDISFVTATIVDKNGNPAPLADNRLNFKVTGKGTFRAVCNGDATSLEMFHHPTMKAFNGKLVVLVQSGFKAGEIELKVSGSGLKSSEYVLKVVNP
ncbi:glycoside hydrolase family 2 TIM barrel-domain containing protein [Flavivirga jejuensis]|uniref:Glycoside hydrolase family 2 TIM barrel-domain containing protein n=1 Tax=Flavivirga jejuensis TaxID=870487 RepID=A0ABT8WLC3_9FLAO|nr:glycoside hydrolase family 2 TIM barrel-domain containing protein [Flavivirga jejuensis]MDO5973955.1 glycoside hydrolase family 2 TIM barrel-domain containing protein [Flavivirga jejuensis]